MTNLLEDTRAQIKNSGHETDDIVFIGSADGKYRMTWEEFLTVADFEYDSGFGGQEIASDLIIRFSDGKKMWRGEYDGSEWWEYDSPANVDYTQPGLPITKLKASIGWDTIESIATRKDDE